MQSTKIIKFLIFNYFIELLSAPNIPKYLPDLGTSYYVKSVNEFLLSIIHN